MTKLIYNKSENSANHFISMHTFSILVWFIPIHIISTGLISMIVSTISLH